MTSEICTSSETIQKEMKLERKTKSELSNNTQEINELFDIILSKSTFGANKAINR